MLPTLKNGDYVITKKIQKIQRNQIVIFNFQNSLMIKRVVGIAGDHILIKEGQVYLNQSTISNDYLEGLPESNYTDFHNLTIPDNNLYLLGDNRRQSSKDSRELGSIKHESVSEIVLIRIWPLKFFR